jgi:hypothetical protein
MGQNKASRRIRAIQAYKELEKAGFSSVATTFARTQTYVLPSV